jgi:pimeloyl-ACP methyl ester carboxylesterase
MSRSRHAGRPIARRDALAALGAIALAGCHKKSEPGPWTDGATEGGAWKDVAFKSTPDTPEGERAMVYVPNDAKDLGVLVALHGRGESGNGLGVGAQAWPKDYELDRLNQRLHRPPLVAKDLLDVVKPERLAKINEALAAEAYRGMTIACPYAPYQAAVGSAEVAPFLKFVIDQLLPRARAEGGAKATREATGIDGVSMGGRLALLMGLTRPDIFGAVGALQPAVNAEEAEMWSRMAQKAMKEHPLKLKLVTSEQDFFRDHVKAIAARLQADGVPHELAVLPGAHGYTFNRGAGGVEMLLWHDRVARGLQPT